MGLDDESNGIVSDYVMLEDEEIAQLSETHFGTVAASYLSQYVRDDRSIDTVYGIRR
jgi:hypothetical protein